MGKSLILDDISDRLLGIIHNWLFLSSFFSLVLGCKFSIHKKPLFDKSNVLERAGEEDELAATLFIGGDL